MLQVCSLLVGLAWWGVPQNVAHTPPTLDSVLSHCLYKLTHNFKNLFAGNQKCLIHCLFVAGSLSFFLAQVSLPNTSSWHQLYWMMLVPNIKSPGIPIIVLVTDRNIRDCVSTNQMWHYNIHSNLSRQVYITLFALSIVKSNLLTLSKHILTWFKIHTAQGTMECKGKDKNLSNYNIVPLYYAVSNYMISMPNTGIDSADRNASRNFIKA